MIVHPDDYCDVDVMISNWHEKNVDCKTCYGCGQRGEKYHAASGCEVVKEEFKRKT